VLLEVLVVFVIIEVAAADDKNILGLSGSTRGFICIGQEIVQHLKNKIIFKICKYV